VAYHIKYTLCRRTQPRTLCDPIWQVTLRSSAIVDGLPIKSYTRL